MAIQDQSIDESRITIPKNVYQVRVLEVEKATSKAKDGKPSVDYVRVTSCELVNSSPVELVDDDGTSQTVDINGLSMGNFYISNLEPKALGKLNKFLISYELPPITESELPDFNPAIIVGKVISVIATTDEIIENDDRGKPLVNPLSGKIAARKFRKITQYLTK